MPVFYYTILFGSFTVFVYLCPNKEFKFHFKLVSDETTKTQLLHQNSEAYLFFIVSKWATLSWPDAGFVSQNLAALQLGKLLQFCTLLHTQVKATSFFIHTTAHTTLCHLGEPRPPSQLQRVTAPLRKALHSHTMRIPSPDSTHTFLKS